MQLEGPRERKKRATRTALGAAALRLALERGYDQITVDDIASAAGVSQRTFFNYFPTKQDALIGDDLARGRQFVEAMAAAPVDAPLWETLQAVAKATMPYSELTADERAAKERLAKEDAAFLSAAMATFGVLEEELVEELASRLPDAPPLYARLLANATSAAIRAATETWLATESGTPESYEELLAQAFESLRPAPPSRP